jgi:UDP-glucuronate 4-epimerase
VKVLVTGAAGFIGSNLAARLASNGAEVLGIDCLSPYYSPELKRRRITELLLPLGIMIDEFNLTELREINSKIRNFHPETVIHLAAQPGVRTPINKSDSYIQNNLVAFSNILQCVVDLGVPNFLYASSSSVYGNSADIPYQEDNKSIEPISIYGATKLSNELLTPTFVSESNTRARGMRFFTVYGPWGRPDMAYFRIIDSALNGTTFTRFGAGDVKRDFTFVDDITGMIESLTNELKTHRPGFSDVVNIGGGSPYSLNDLIKVISEEIDSNINISEIASNPNDAKFTSANVERLMRLTGKKPEVDLKEGVRRTIAWASQKGIRENLLTWANSTL